MSDYARKEGDATNTTAVRELRKDRFRKFKSVREPVSRDFGNVTAIIYANETHIGRIVFKVELVRVYTMTDGSGEAFSFEFNDIPDAIRALKWALGWLWRARRHQRAIDKRWL